ncbi:cyclopropane-fatty-acyl-phospholipid synthase [Flexivirga endophytica]|uniref:Cyclopropane-fatty-acyl-phospholipid synthase n=1 Tax=Flexivirga endophytica TaxID=1849103 RepID=A0A916THQ4_9MICO|nr:cyclopropane-fatty-acyl-phospholipid synthase family protein [Flexivirga endophytica]GGB45606.1 cyclopropane-fatty-acyl-phospholipid synthase [Flexivirga endophytica]GHB66419.1 cyclopropane-fatty-acyl-phospholipid synthase [Flexivirga endophytica]
MTAVRVSGVADTIQEALRPILRGRLPVRLTAWDRSVAGDPDAPEVRLNSPNALRRLLWHPGELGAAQAYVAGDIELDTPVTQVLQHVRRVGAERDLAGRTPRPQDLAIALRGLAATGGLGARPPTPGAQIQVRGRLHSRRRDSDVIHHHYDVDSDFYALVLDDTMAYSCAYVTRGDLAGCESDGYRLEDAQRDKLDLVCRKIGLDQRSGMQMLDVGCGWGALSLHAAEHYGAIVTGVTISNEQKSFVDKRIRDRSLQDRVTVELRDYRDVAGRYDAVASLEMGEHAGDKGYPDFARVLHDAASDDARVLIQQMSRRGRHPGGGPFIEAFIAPDMTMRPVGNTIELLEQGGLEVRDVHALREHYAWTVRSWQRRFEQHRAAIAQLVPAETVRVWELYLAGGLLAFEEGRMGVDQIVAVRRRRGSSGLPARRPASWSDPRG